MLFSWFAKKHLPPADTLTSLGQGMNAATIPHRKESSSGFGNSVPHGSGRDERRTERHLRREQLFVVVRDIMLKAGVLSSHFKFKVLSLDSRGRQYVVMMELAWIHKGETDRLAEIENQIAVQAKNQHDILVTAVYWRVNEFIAAGQIKSSPNTPSSRPAPFVAVKLDAGHPLRPDGFDAFKRALVSGSGTAQRLSNSGEIVQPLRPRSAGASSFAPTTIDEQNALSGTQYGTL